MPDAPRPAVAILRGGPHAGRWELPNGWHFPQIQEDEGGQYVLIQMFGEQYKGRPPKPTKDGGLYEWRPDASGS